MNKNFLSIWEEMHSKFYYRKVLDKNIAASWDYCYSKGFNPSNFVLKTHAKHDLNKIVAKAHELYFFANEPLKRVEKELSEDNLGFALFSKDGYLLNLYGNDNFKKQAQKSGIARGTLWNEKAAGTNSVSLGLKLIKPIALKPHENFFNTFSQYLVYFSPISSYEGKSKNSTNNNLYGGIALINFQHDRKSADLVTAIAISNEISLRILMIKNALDFSEHFDLKQGSIAIDRSNEKRNYILYHNKALSYILSLSSHKDTFYKKIEDIIDPYPKNKEFWELFNANQNIKIREILLSVNGKTNRYNVALELYVNSVLKINVTILLIRSTDQINKYISKKIGNNARFTFADIVGESTVFKKTVSMAKKIAAGSANVLITGESGVGKDIFAQAIHNASSRANNPFIAINCAAIPRDLIASELFGYDEGAFTGSKKGGNIGKFELAHTGTIFLDEIGDMPVDLQATLLRVLEEKSLMRLGSSLLIISDVRIIAATNVNLSEKIMQKKFREDLYYRLSSLRLQIPPLRHRAEDIVLLAKHFINLISMRINKPIPSLSQAAWEYIMRLSFNGNIRELQNLIEGIVQLYDVPILTQDHIIEYLEDIRLEQPVAVQKNIIVKNHSHIKSHIPDSRKAIEEALALNRYNREKAAEYLGISKRTLYRRMKEYNI